ncbi:MAG: hypothetical protein V4508_25345 [Pseudomonadota bacterium]
MKFNIYGRFQVDVRREGDAWVVFRIEDGKRAKMHDIVVPESFANDDIATYLDDIFHEFAGLGQGVERIA